MEDKQKHICECVRNLCHEMIVGNVSDDLLYLYGISKEYLEICRDPTHMSYKKFTDELFRHIMSVIGYYECINDKERLNELADSIDEKLKHPVSIKDRKILYLPKILYGVKRVLNRIRNISDSNYIEFDDKKNVSDLKISKSHRAFIVSYRRDPNAKVAMENSSSAISINIGSETVLVPPDGRHMREHQINFTDKDSLLLQIDSFQTDTLNDKQAYFFRYVTEVEKIPHILGRYDCKQMDIDGLDVNVIDTVVDSCPLYVYFITNNAKNYLIIDYDKALPVRDMRELCFSVTLSLGMLICDVHLNDCWLAAYDSIEKESENGFFLWIVAFFSLQLRNFY